MNAIKPAHPKPPQIAYLAAYPLFLLCMPPYAWQHSVAVAAVWVLGTVGIIARWKSVFWLGFVVTLFMINSSAQELLSPSSGVTTSAEHVARLVLAACAIFCLQTTTVLEWFGFRFSGYTRGTCWLSCAAFAVAFLPGVIAQLWMLACRHGPSQL
jgi:hypothetical protein